MKFIIAILFIALASPSFSQQDSLYGSIPEIKLLSGLSVKQLKGEYITQDDYEGMRITLTNSGKFIKEYFGCTDNILIDSGTWVCNGSSIGLAGINNDEQMDIVQMGNYILLVPAAAQNIFINEVKQILNAFKHSMQPDNLALRVMGTSKLIICGRRRYF